MIFSKEIVLASVVSSLFVTTVSADEPLIDKKVVTENIKVGSYNIRASRTGSTNDLVDVIRQMDADIIGLQEVDNMTVRSGNNFDDSGKAKPINQAAYLAEKLNMNYYFCKAVEHDGGEYGTAVISKYPLSLRKREHLPNIDGGEQRSACAVEVDVPNYPAPVMLVTTHLDFTTQPLRAEQVRTLQTQFSSWQFKDSLPIIVGDLNLPPQSMEYQDLTAWFNETDKDLKNTAPAWNPDRKIDYILTSNAQVWEVKEAFVPHPSDSVGDTIYAKISDHLPLTVTMKLVRQ